ncbi:hypothetical protein Pan216_18490 [Planctomycetes bacterium Pan216]|uniref:DUF502 domain-containing protein n=1 Tax=Kolteria novifilia TaxID=2527975 RepID=A0A518B237_9BACT|nr:hypothetical protein Pan216_18490 [Planctomycetes bacterium Pan216]
MSVLPPTDPSEDPTPRGIIELVRKRIIGGTVLILPFAITAMIIAWLYQTVRDSVIEPVAMLIIKALTFSGRVHASESGDLPYWIEDWVAPLLAIVAIGAGLYMLGMLVHSRLDAAFDWIFRKLPGVTVIYNAVRGVFNSVQQSKTGMRQFKRVVLVSFPHPGTRVPAFVTSTCVDTESGKTILCLYVPTTPVPTSGYMLLVPEEDVVELNWDLDETLRAVISGGISVPETVSYSGLPSSTEETSS